MSGGVETMTTVKSRPQIRLLDNPYEWKNIRAIVVGLILVFLTYKAAGAVEFSLSKLWDGTPFMADFLTRMFPPDLSILPRALQETLLTIELAWISTIIAAVISVPIGFIAASNIVKSAILRK